ncbi:MAG: hypothetical protein ACK5MG_01715 [Bacteroidales bacterium]
MTKDSKSIKSVIYGSIERIESVIGFESSRGKKEGLNIFHQAIIQFV